MGCSGRVGERIVPSFHKQKGVIDTLIAHVEARSFGIDQDRPAEHRKPGVTGPAQSSANTRPSKTIGGVDSVTGNKSALFFALLFVFQRRNIILISKPRHSSPDASPNDPENSRYGRRRDFRRCVSLQKIFRTVFKNARPLPYQKERQIQLSAVHFAADLRGGAGVPSAETGTGSGTRARFHAVSRVGGQLVRHGQVPFL